MSELKFRSSITEHAWVSVIFLYVITYQRYVEVVWQCRSVTILIPAPLFCFTRNHVWRLAPVVFSIRRGKIYYFEHPICIHVNRTTFLIQLFSNCFNPSHDSRNESLPRNTRKRITKPISLVRLENFRYQSYFYFQISGERVIQAEISPKFNKKPLNVWIVWNSKITAFGEWQFCRAKQFELDKWIKNQYWLH